MITNPKDEFQTYWTLIIIDDPLLLTGKSILNTMKFVLKSVKFKFVILDDIEGSGKNWLISNLQDKKDVVIGMDDFLKILNDVEQFDWGDFFLFKTYPKNWDNPKNFYPDVIVQTDTTIRAVDNQYIYIYTPYQEVIDIIKNNFPIESIKKDSLDNLDYPY